MEGRRKEMEDRKGSGRGGMKEGVGWGGEGRGER